MTGGGCVGYSEGVRRWAVRIKREESGVKRQTSSVKRKTSNVGRKTPGGIDMGERWLELFEREDVQFVVLDPREDRSLVETLQSHRGWAVDYEDTDGVVFARVR